MPVYLTLDAFAGNRFEYFGLREFNFALLSAGNDCRRQRMLAAALETRGQP